MKKLAFAAAIAALFAGAAVAGRITDTTGLNLLDLTQPGGNVTGSATYSTFTVEHLFDDVLDVQAGRWLATWNAASGVYIAYTFDEETEVDGYSFLDGGMISPNRAPKTFQIRGSNDYNGKNFATATWEVLDSIDDDGKWTAREPRYYRFDKAAKYKSYCLYVTAIYLATEGYCQATEMQLHNYTAAEKKCTVTVNTVVKGEVVATSTTECKALEEVVVNVPAAPEGKQFHMWTGDGITKSTKRAFTVTLAPADDMTVNAVFYDPADVTPIRRYAAPTGTGDGTSWETASSLADAWEAVGDNPGGGEVWAKTGFYKIGTTYRLYPNVVLRGGFDGPTIISGDGNSPDYWSHLDAATGRVWDGTTFNSPFADGVDPVGIYAKGGGDNVNTGFADIPGFKVDNGFYDVTLTSFGYNAIKIDEGDGHALVCSNCQFLANFFNDNAVERTISLYDTDARFENCLFEGNRNVFFVNAAAGASASTAVLSGCTVRNNGSVTSGGCGGAVLNGTATLIITNSAFAHNWMESTGNSGARAAILRMNGTGTIRAFDSIFDGNQSVDVFNGGIKIVSGDAEFVRCRFERNRAVKTSGVGASASSPLFCVDSGSALVVRDSAFLGNVSSNATLASCLWADAGKVVTRFVNCTFEGNRAVNETATAQVGTVQTGKGAIGDTTAKEYSFINCLFWNNEALADGVRTWDIYVDPLRFTSSASLVVNTVVAHPSADYKGFYPGNDRNTIGRSQIANNYLQGYDRGGSGAVNQGFYADVVTEGEVGLADEPVVKGTVTAHGLRPGSKFRKAGRPVWQGTDGEYYMIDVMDATRWRKLGEAQTYLTDDEAAAVGVTREAAPVPDAFGEPRRADRIALGPLSVQPLGLMLLVK